MIAIYLAVGGAAGAIARYYLQGWVVSLLGPAPWGTFAVNVLGAFLLGFFLTLTEERFLVPSLYRTFVAVGFIGSFTTFSTLMWESQQLLNVGDVPGAMANLAGSVVAGIAAVYLGVAAGRLV
ncbi:MAG TPA: fluoride efflux transporter CrcB [Dehalococcoidia bacterium]|nr:fluoride efflux transporter CrcB [Dehalococcoidia bacterium]